MLHIELERPNEVGTLTRPQRIRTLLKALVPARFARGIGGFLMQSGQFIQGLHRVGEPFKAPARGSRARRIIVSSNCVTGGLTACLASLLPERDVVAIPVPSTGNRQEAERLHTALENAEIWVTSDPTSAQAFPRSRTILIPVLTFRAFHPDLTYAIKTPEDELVNLHEHYNSLLILKAWDRGLSEAAARELFAPKVLEELGYLDFWDESVRALKAIFERTDMNFGAFFPGVKRMGAFMHSINHPKLPVLMQMASQIASRVEREKTQGGASVLPLLQDGLSHTLWPIYPPIAESYGLIGSYDWLIKGTPCRGLDAYIRHSFHIYTVENVQRGQIRISGSWGERFSTALERQLGRLG